MLTNQPVLSFYYLGSNILNTIDSMWGVYIGSISYLQMDWPWMPPGLLPVNMPLVVSTGPVLVQCWQHRPSTEPVLAHNGSSYWVSSTETHEKLIWAELRNETHFLFLNTTVFTTYKQPWIRRSHRQYNMRLTSARQWAPGRTSVWRIRKLSNVCDVMFY